MNILINKASKALFNIIKKNYSYKASIKEVVLLENDKINLAPLYQLVIASLRHFLLISYFIKQKFISLNEDDFFLVLVCISDKLFSHQFNEEELIEYLKNNLISSECSAICEEFKKLSEKNDLFCSNEKNLSYVDYFSLRFNVPSWAIKLWRNHFGNKICLNMCKNMFKNKKFVSVNKYHNVNDDFDAEIFKLTSVDGLLEYIARGPLKNQKALTEHKVFIANPAIKEALNYSNFSSFSNVAIYTNYVNCINEEILNYVLNEGNVDLICSSPQIKNNFEWLIKAIHLRNFHVYECPISSVITCLSNKVHNFVIAPKGSYLNNLKNEPDYFLKCQNTGLDELIKEEEILLEDAFSCVEEEGYVTYIIPTANKKESSLIIEEFLKSHSNAQLVKQKQFLPDDEFDICYYYAVIKKVNENEN